MQCSKLGLYSTTSSARTLPRKNENNKNPETEASPGRSTKTEESMQLALPERLRQRTCSDGYARTYPLESFHDGPNQECVPFYSATAGSLALRSWIKCSSRCVTKLNAAESAAWLSPFACFMSSALMMLSIFSSIAVRSASLRASRIDPAKA